MSDDKKASQDDVDNMFGGGPAKAGMALNEIDVAPELKGMNEQDYEVGQPMAGDVSAIYDIPAEHPPRLEQRERNNVE